MHWHLGAHMLAEAGAGSGRVQETGLVAGWGRGPPPVVPVVPVVPGETWLLAHKWPDILALGLC